MSERSKALPATCIMLVCCFSYSSILKMEATCILQILAGFQLTAWHYIPAERTYHTHSCENIKSYKDSQVGPLSTGKGNAIYATFVQLKTNSNYSIYIKGAWKAVHMQPFLMPLTCLKGL
jgi:hypothetical protein